MQPYQYTPTFSQPPEKTLWWRRTGLLGLWFSLTAPPRPTDMSSLKTREIVRKAEMTSLTIFAYVLFSLLLTFNILSDPSTALAIGGGMVIAILATFFNRSGHITIAAYLILLMIMSMTMLSIVKAVGGLRLIWFTTYDLFALPVFISFLLIEKRGAVLCTFLCIAFTVGDYLIHPHALITSSLGAHQFDEIAYETSQPYFNVWALINRNVLLIAFSGFFGWLAAFSFEKALVWAEQAKREVTIANAVAEHQETTALTLAAFLNEVVTVFVAQANGEAARLRLRPQNDPFHQAVLLLNERLHRLETLRKQEQHVWKGVQMTAGLQSLNGLLNGIRQGHLSPLTLAEFHTSIEIINQLSQQMFLLLTSVQAAPPSTK